MYRTRLSILAAACVLIATTAPADESARFAATVTGRGPDVILIPGLASSGAVWDATAKALASTHRVHVLHVAGFAGVPPGPNATGPVLPRLVDDIADYAASLDHPAVIGHSMGGLVGLEVAAARPAAIGRLMIVEALPFYSLVFNPSATVTGVTPQAAMLRDRILALSADAYEQSQAASVTNMAKSDEARARVREWALASDRRVVATAMYEDMTTDARARLARIGVPVTVVYAYDAAMGVPVAAVDRLYSSAYDTLAGAKLIRIDGGYHFIMLDQPEAFAREVESFLSSTRQR